LHQSIQLVESNQCQKEQGSVLVQTGGGCRGRRTTPCSPGSKARGRARNPGIGLESQ
jgi:hypothetical protein